MEKPQPPPPQGQPPMQYAPPQQPYPAQPPMQASMPPPGPNWSNDLCDCSPLGSCCLATFLPCCLFGKTSDRLRDPTMATANAMNADCMVFSCLQCFTGCGWVMVMMKRSEIRERFGIHGSGMGDCCVTFWCPCCALIQQDNEVKERTRLLGPTRQGYQAQPGMIMP